MGQVNSYRDLRVWQDGMDLAESCYHLTRSLPREEMFGMSSQTWRAAASIPANIAEGWGRESTQEYLRFLRIAQGSLKELETHLLLCQRVRLISKTQVQPILENCDRLGRMLRGLNGSLRRRRDMGK